MADEIHLPFGQIKVVVCFSFHLTIFTRESRNSMFGGKNTSRGGHAGASLLPRQSRWDWNRLIVSQKSRKAEWKSLTTFLWLKMETNFSKLKSEIFLREGRFWQETQLCCWSTFIITNSESELFELVTNFYGKSAQQEQRIFSQDETRVESFPGDESEDEKNHRKLFFFCGIEEKKTFQIEEEI